MIKTENMKKKVILLALVEDNLFGHIDKVQIAIDRLKAFEPKEGI